MNMNRCEKFFKQEFFFKLSLYKMNIKTNLLEEYVNFFDSAKKQNTY